MIKEYPYYFVFDVESVGLHGECFSFGYVVLDKNLNHVTEKEYYTYPNNAIGDYLDREWADQNVSFSKYAKYSPSTHSLRKKFWKVYSYWRNKEASFWADCLWPVESNFLSQCMKEEMDRVRIDNPLKVNQLKNEGPYPFFDISTLALAVGNDPVANNWRANNEKPKHCALHDARQSARLLRNYLSKLNE